jgi:hypothetical protein
MFYGEQKSTCRVHGWIQLLDFHLSPRNFLYPGVLRISFMGNQSYKPISMKLLIPLKLKTISQVERYALYQFNVVICSFAIIEVFSLQFVLIKFFY